MGIRKHISRIQHIVSMNCWMCSFPHWNVTRVRWAWRGRRWEKQIVRIHSWRDHSMRHVVLRTTWDLLTLDTGTSSMGGRRWRFTKRLWTSWCILLLLKFIIELGCHGKVVRLSVCLIRIERRNHCLLLISLDNRLILPCWRGCGIGPLYLFKFKILLRFVGGLTLLNFWG